MKDKILKFVYKILFNQARRVYKKHKPTVIAITGSVGKTSTKEAIAKVLEAEFSKEQVFATFGNLNAEIGVPLTVLGYEKMPNKFMWPVFLIGSYFRSVFVRKYPKYLVIEMGVERAGDIRYFCSIVKPDIAVITAATAAHLENFASISDMQNEKISLATEVSEKGMVIFNGEDEFLRNNLSGQKYGFSAEYDAFACEIEIMEDGTRFLIEYGAGNYRVKNSLMGDSMILSQLAAFLVGVNLKIDPKKICETLSTLKPVVGRLNLLRGDRGEAIIDDSYNANPASAKMAIDLIEKIKTNRRKVLILGNMNELGSDSKKMHKNVGEYAKYKVDSAIFLGENARFLAEGFCQGDPKKCYVYRDSEKLKIEIKNLIMPGDLVLIKGSQNGVFLEEITKVLIDHKYDAKKVLVRQSDFWIKKKNN